MPHFTQAQQRAIDQLARDLDSVFGPRLESLVAYPGNQGDGSTHSCALVHGLAFRDLTSCLPYTARMVAYSSGKTSIVRCSSSDESLATLAETRMGVPAALIRSVLASSGGGHSTITDPSHLLGGYIDASHKIWQYVDGWRA